MTNELRPRCSCGAVLEYCCPNDYHCSSCGKTVTAGYDDPQLCDTCGTRAKYDHFDMCLYCLKAGEGLDDDDIRDIIANDQTRRSLWNNRA